MLFSKTVQQAILLVIFIAKQGHNQRQNLIEILTYHQCPNISYCKKILAKLTKYKVLTSFQGPNGGYILTKNADETSLFNIVTAIEGQFKSIRCFVCNSENEANKRCELHHFISPLQEKWLRFLTTTTIEQLIPKEEAKLTDHLLKNKTS